MTFSLLRLRKFLLASEALAVEAESLLAEPPNALTENLDAIGAFLTKDGEVPVDAAAKLLTGESFVTGAELTAILPDKRRENFIRDRSEKMLICSLAAVWSAPTAPLSTRS